MAEVNYYMSALLFDLFNTPTSSLCGLSHSLYYHLTLFSGNLNADVKNVLIKLTLRHDCVILMPFGESEQNYTYSKE